MNNHTPGPWIVEHSGTGDARVIARCGWVNKDGSPFDPTIVERIDFPTARLIAAAPELLAALIECESIITYSYEALRYAVLPEACKQARAAIARATVPTLT